MQVVLPKHLGDAVMALPALRLLARDGGGALSIVAREPTADLVAGQGPWSRTPTLRRRTPVVLLAPSFRAAFGAVRAGCRPRVGLATDSRAPLLTHPVDRAPALGALSPAGLPRLLPVEHQADAFLRVARAALVALGGDGAGAVGDDDRRFRPLPDDERAAERWRAVAGFPDVLLHPHAAGLATRRWSAGSWSLLGRALLAAGRRVAVTGGPGGDDARFAAELGAALQVPVAAGPSVLRPGAWAAAARRADAVVAPDTGVAHLAGAAGARVVVLFGPTDPLRHAPFAPAGLRLIHGGSGLPCAPCYRDPCRAPAPLQCQRAWSVDAILEAVESLRPRVAS